MQRTTRSRLLYLLLSIALHGAGCGDATVRNLSTDLATPDLATADLATADLADAAVPADLATALPDLTEALPDLADAADPSDASAPTFAIGGTVSGLAGVGLVLDNEGDELPIAEDGAFTFAKKLAAGAPYAVTVKTQPTGPTQTCDVTDGSSTVSGDVTGIVVACTPRAFTVGGSVNGLRGTLILQDNDGDDLSLHADGSFTFATKIVTGMDYAVTIKTQPLRQTCTVVNGSGPMGTANITGISVTCLTTLFTIGGTVSGLGGTVVLQNNFGDDLSVNANGPFTFATALPSGSPYSVTVKTQPATKACTITDGSDTVPGADVTNIAVSCISN